jgi:hypothetical protein
VKAGVDVSA